MPNMLIPLHKDKYYYFRKKFNISKNQNIFRVQIFLQDWMPGHYFEIEKKPIVKWHAGHYILLDKTMDHRSANVGKVPKYTAQVTGILK